LYSTSQDFYANLRRAHYVYFQKSSRVNVTPNRIHNGVFVCLCVLQ